jgi:hypothetical protein
MVLLVGRVPARPARQPATCRPETVAHRTSARWRCGTSPPSAGPLPPRPAWYVVRGGRLFVAAPPHTTRRYACACGPPRRPATCQGPEPGSASGAWAGREPMPMSDLLARPMSEPPPPFAEERRRSDCTCRRVEVRRSVVRSMRAKRASRSAAASWCWCLERCTWRETRSNKPPPPGTQNGSRDQGW